MERIVKRGWLLLPIFLRRQWVAGVPFYDTEGGGFRPVVRGPALTPVVRNDLWKVLRKFFPDVDILRCRFARQKRGSNDCWRFMSAAFFGYELGFAPKTHGLYDATLATHLPFSG